ATLSGSLRREPGTACHRVSRMVPSVHVERALSLADPALSPRRGAAGRSDRAHDRGGSASDDVADGTRGVGARRAVAAELSAQRDAEPPVSAGRAARRGMTPLRELNPDFRDLLLAFAAEGVEFVVVGAYALALHGVPRFTGDLDVFVRPSPENARRVWHALASFGAPVDAAGVRPGDFATPGIVYQIGLPPARIDVLRGL